MTWAAGRRNPLIIFPAKAITYPRFTGSLGSSTDNWAGTAGCSIVTGEGATGTYCARIHATASSEYLTQKITIASKFKSYTAEAAAGPLYLYFRPKLKTYTANSYLEFKFRWLDSGSSIIGSAIQTFWPLGSSTTSAGYGEALPATGAWGLRRSVTAIPDMPSNAAYAEIVIGRPSASETFDLFIDDVRFGHACDFQELTGATASGATIKTPYTYKTTEKEDFEINQAGVFSSRIYNEGQARGEFETTAFSDSSRAYWDKFFKYAMGANQFILYHEQHEGVRNFLDHLVADQVDDGIEPIDGMNTMIAHLKYLGATA